MIARQRCVGTHWPFGLRWSGWHCSHRGRPVVRVAHEWLGRRVLFRLLRVEGARRWLLTAAVGAVVLLFWGSLLVHNWSGLASLQLSFDATGLVTSTLAFCTYFLGQAVGWVLITRALGYPLEIGAGAAVWLLSMPARYVPGNFWHVTARVRLAQRHRVPAEGVLAASTLEQALALLSAGSLGVAWLPHWSGMGSIIWLAASLLLCLVAIQPPVLAAALRLASKMLRKATPRFPFSYRHIVPLAAWYILVNTANGTAFFLLADTAAHPQLERWPLLVSAYCLAYVLGYISFLTPSGIGVREAALAAMLSISMPMPAAIALSLLSRLASMGGEAAAVLLVGLPLAHLRRGL